MDNQQVTQTEIAWLAGFIDGEGSIGIYGSRRKDGSLNYGARIQVASANGHAIEKIVSILDRLGISRRIYQREFENKNYSDSFYTTVNRLASLKILLPLLIPYLVIKRPHATLMLHWVSSRTEKGINRGGNQKKNTYSDIELDLIDQLQELNKSKGNPTDYTHSPSLEGEDIVGSYTKV